MRTAHRASHDAVILDARLERVEELLEVCDLLLQRLILQQRAYELAV